MKTRFWSEFLGTAFLLMIIVGSGIMGEMLANGNQAITLLANSLATGLGLVVLIGCLGEVSGAHFNPLVSLIEFLFKNLKREELIIYWSAQFLGAIVGIYLTHLMFNQNLIQLSLKDRSTPNLWLSEFIATFGLISVILLTKKRNIEFSSVVISAYITAAYWFTSSTSFANPAVTVARMFTNSFTGITVQSVPVFILAEIAGALVSFYLMRKIVR